jgi:hypothetical protein
MRKLVAGVAVAVVVLTVAAGLASAVPAGPVVSPSTHVGGRTYAGWVIAKWQWLLAHGRATAGHGVGTVPCIARGQRGKVWFLENEYEGDAPVTVKCEVPAGRYLLLVGPDFECSTVEPAPFGATRAGLQRCVAKFKFAGAQVTLDGRALSPSGYTVATPVFRFTMPARSNFLKVTGRTHGYSAARSYVLMLRPLTPGTHTIVQVVHFTKTIETQATWELVVR